MSDEIENIESEEVSENVEEESRTSDFHRHHPRKVLLNYLVLGIFILFVLLYIGTHMEDLRPLMNVVGVETSAPVEIKNETVALNQAFELPPFPEELDWVEIEEFDNYYDVIYRNKDYSEYGHIEVTGKLYQATTSINAIGEKSYQYAYMDNLRSNFGWTQDLSFGGINYQGQSAGGPMGDLWGLVKEIDGKISTVIFTEEISNSCLSTGEPGDIVWPCEKTYRIFVSDGFGPISNDNGWKTYRNGEYGFEFEYPHNYQAKDVTVPGTPEMEIVNATLLRTKENVEVLNWNVMSSRGDDVWIYPSAHSSVLKDLLGVSNENIALTKEFFTNESNFFVSSMNKYIGPKLIDKREGILISHSEYGKDLYFTTENQDGTYFIARADNSDQLEPILDSLKFYDNI